MKAVLLAFFLAAPTSASWFSSGAATLESPKHLFDGGHFAQAAAEIESTLDKMNRSDQREAYLYLGTSYERLGRNDKALGVYQLGVRLFPKDLNLLTRLAGLLHTSGLGEQAEPFYQRALLIHPHNTEAHLGLARIDHALGFYGRAAEHYDKALELLQDQEPVWREYGEMMLSAHEPATAELAAKKALALRPGDPEATFVLARAQRDLGRLDEALQALGAAMAAAPDRLDFVVARGLWLLEVSRYDEALATAQTLLKAQTPPPLAYWIRARVRLHADQYRAAVEDLKRVALEERSSPFCAKAARGLLEQLGAQ